MFTDVELEAFAHSDGGATVAVPCIANVLCCHPHPAEHGSDGRENTSSIADPGAIVPHGAPNSAARSLPSAAETSQRWWPASAAATVRVGTAVYWTLSFTISTACSSVVYTWNQPGHGGTRVCTVDESSMGARPR